MSNAKAKPYTTLPKNYQKITNNWPPAGGQAIQVGPGDNWYTLAIRYGYTNPWDIIRYNFDTVTPSEVNFYLNALLGCTLVTKDGKNYRFGKVVGNAVESVTLYIPQMDWEPDGPVNTPSRPPIDETDMDLAVQVRNVFLHPGVQRINFVISGRPVGPAQFNNVKRLVESGAIAVYVKPNDGKPAYYDHTTNSFHLRKGHASDPNWAATVIHEAVHAAMDFDKVKDIYELDSEAAAYIAQCWYFIVRLGYSGGLPEGKTAAGTKVMQAAYEVAIDLDKEREFNYDHLYDLRFAITQHPEYANWKLWTNFDGVAE